MLAHHLPTCRHARGEDAGTTCSHCTRCCVHLGVQARDVAVVDGLEVGRVQRSSAHLLQLAALLELSIHVGVVGIQQGGCSTRSCCRCSPSRGADAASTQQLLHADVEVRDCVLKGH
jgi:hypothetical protein